MIIFHHGMPAWIVKLHHTMDVAVITTLGDQFGSIAAVINGLICESHSAVALFMTLSGFLFARISDGNQLHYKGFFINRVLRIYPLFTCALLLAMYLQPQNNGLIALLTSLLLGHNTPGAISHATLTPHLWSISVEFQFYLLFPFLLTFCRSRGSRYLFLLLLLAITVRYLAFGAFHDVRMLAYLSIFGRIDCFIIGMLLGTNYPVLQKFTRHPLIFLTAATAIMIGLTIFHKCGGFFGTEHKAIWVYWPTVEAALWGALIISYCNCAMHIPRTVSKALSFLGSLSFSLYVNHYFLCQLIPTKVLPALERASHESGFFATSANWLLGLDYWLCLILTLFVMLPVITLVSLLTYNVIEKPFLDMRVKYAFNLKVEPRPAPAEETA